MPIGGKLRFEYKTWPSLTHPRGPLPRDKRAQACWYYYTLAQKLYEQVGDSIEDQFGTLEGDLWLDKRYRQLAKATAIIYQLESPDEFAKFWKYVKACAVGLGLPAPQGEYMRPCPRDLIH